MKMKCDCCCERHHTHPVPRTFTRQKRETAKELKNLNRKRTRLLKRARELNEEDLAELYHFRAAAKAKAKAHA